MPDPTDHERELIARELHAYAQNLRRLHSKEWPGSFREAANFADLHAKAVLRGRTGKGRPSMKSIFEDAE